MHPARGRTATGGARSRPYRVGLVSFLRIRAFDVSVLTEVWGTVRTTRGVPPFTLLTLRRAAATPDSVAMSGGLSLAPNRSLGRLARADLVVAPGLESPAAFAQAAQPAGSSPIAR
ncbi:hypothetical protein [Streptomyces sp. AK02-01A]|uniref:hypothetical protein n=1 Tax=Streptomyces sp. AK02-01A TaxID=3028648 RepID=UPI0039F6BF26